MPQTLEIDRPSGAMPPSSMAFADTLPRVAGFSAVVEAELAPDDMRRSLDGLAWHSAFRLTALIEETRPGSSARAYRATFTLAAPRGATGDSQIFALLRSIAERHRWTDVRKTMAVA